MELSGSPASAARSRRPLFRFEGVLTHLPRVAITAPLRPRARLGRGGERIAGIVSGLSALDVWCPLRIA
jgi:hypothetical protein